MNKKFLLGLLASAGVAVLAVKFVAEPLGRKLQASKNTTVAKIGSTIA